MRLALFTLFTLVLPFVSAAAFHSHRPRDLSYFRNLRLCPTGLTACQVGMVGSGWKTGAFECIDVLSDIESCGGCVDEGEGGSGEERGGGYAAGIDCTAIEGADEVACHEGSCLVFSCLAGFVPGAEGSTCEPSLEAGGRKGQQLFGSRRGGAPRWP